MVQKSTQHPTIDTSLQRSYGRVNGRKLRAAQQELLDEVLPPIAVTEDSGFSLFGGDFVPQRRWLEIGFGGGEHLAYQAQHNPDVGIIGCEPFTNGVVRLLRLVQESDCTNVRIFHGDARILVDNIPAASIERVFILFPDPWPKFKHFKKRLIQDAMLDALARIIVPGGLLRIATDHVDYGEWILEHLQRHPLFEPKKVPVTTDAPQDWCVTRYQQKALVQGRHASFFNWSRIEAC